VNDNAMPPTIRAVFFDAVGTLLFPNPSALEVYRLAAQKRGVELTSDTIRNRFIEAYRHEEEIDRASAWVTSEDRERIRWKAIVAATLRELPDAETCYGELFEHFAQPNAWRLHGDAETVIERLRKSGIIIGMGTNYDARIWPVLAGFPILAGLRDRIVMSAAIGFRKPAAEFFREVVRRAGCESHEVLFVGDDRDNDYEGARAAGLQAVLLSGEGRLDPPLEKWFTFAERPGLP
jgi:putative hydrolase of the HAD superfamily